MQCAIDNAKRTFDVDLVEEIERIKLDMNIDQNGYPSFWKHVKDKKAKIGEKKFNAQKINKELKCPMNYLMDLTFENSRSKDITLPMSYFFNKFEIKENRRKSRKVEELIEKYSLNLLETLRDNGCGTDSTQINDSNTILLSDFDELLEDIKTIYISKDYIGLMSWLIDRAFGITPQTKGKKSVINSKTNKNKSLLLKVLYDINAKNVLKIFSNHT